MPYSGSAGATEAEMAKTLHVAIRAHGMTAADLIVINKTDLVTRRQFDELRPKVEAIAARSRIWETCFGKIPLRLIFDDPTPGFRQTP